MGIYQQCRHCTRLKRSEPKLVYRGAQTRDGSRTPIFLAQFLRRSPTILLAIIGDVAFSQWTACNLFPSIFAGVHFRPASRIRELQRPSSDPYPLPAELPPKRHKVNYQKTNV